LAERIIKITTGAAVVAVATVAAIISYQHAYELIRSHGESGMIARLEPFTVDGLIWSASMVILNASRRNQRVPRLAAWSLGAGIVATVGANLAHGLGHGPIGVLVSAWPALALVGAYEMLMMIIREDHETIGELHSAEGESHSAPLPEEGVPLVPTQGPTVEQTVRAWHDAGHSQRAIARELSIDRRKVKQIIIERAA
jgi:Protein of unknown function (DUF2637)